MQYRMSFYLCVGFSKSRIVVLSLGCLQSRWISICRVLFLCMYLGEQYFLIRQYLILFSVVFLIYVYMCRCFCFWKASWQVLYLDSWVIRCRRQMFFWSVWTLVYGGVDEEILGEYICCWYRLVGQTQSLLVFRWYMGSMFVWLVLFGMLVFFVVPVVFLYCPG